MSVGGPLDYSFRFNNYNHPALVAAFDMSTLTPGGLLKNLAKSGATYDGTINGALALVPPLIRAKRTKCMDFDGVNNYISLVNPIVGLTDFSIVFWLNVDANNNIIYGRSDIADDYTYLTGTTNVFFLTGGVAITSPQSLGLNRTFMVCLTRQAASPRERKIYIDGKLVAQSGALAGAPGGANIYIGQYWNGTLRYNGRLDNMMFYNIAFTQEQVWALQKSSTPR